MRRVIVFGLDKRQIDAILEGKVGWLWSRRALRAEDLVFFFDAKSKAISGSGVTAFVVTAKYNVAYMVAKRLDGGRGKTEAQLKKQAGKKQMISGAYIIHTKKHDPPIEFSAGCVDDFFGNREWVKAGI